MDQKLAEKNNQKVTKLMFGVLCFLGVSTLILGIFQVMQTLNPYVAVDPNTQASADIDFGQGLDNIEKSVDELKQMDTDGDGLSDYEEMYIYGTSVYLADSDSDGYDDKSEVDGGFDPNCPKGEDCRGTADVNFVEPANPVVPDNTEPLGGEVTEEITPDQIRQFILESGQMTQEQLDAIDNETLIQVWNQVVEDSENL